MKGVKTLMGNERKGSREQVTDSVFEIELYRNGQQ